MTKLMHNYVIQYVYYYNPLHVSSSTVLIIRRSNFINTASGTLFSVSDRPVCRLRCTVIPPRTNLSLFDLNTQSVPRSKHSLPRL